VAAHRALRECAELGFLNPGSQLSAWPERLIAAAAVAARPEAGLPSPQPAESKVVAAFLFRQPGAGFVPWPEMGGRPGRKPSCSALAGHLQFATSLRNPGSITERKRPTAGPPQRCSKALSNQLSGPQTGPAPVQIGVSFRSKGGHYCRTFQPPGGGLPWEGWACNEGGNWKARDTRPLGRRDLPTIRNTGPAGCDLTGPPSSRPSMTTIVGDPLDAKSEGEVPAIISGASPHEAGANGPGKRASTPRGKTRGPLEISGGCPASDLVTAGPLEAAFSWRPLSMKIVSAPRRPVYALAR